MITNLLHRAAVSRRRREMYCGHARLCVCLRLAIVCLRVCLSVRGRMPTLLHGPGCNLGECVCSSFVLKLFFSFYQVIRLSSHKNVNKYLYL